MIFQSVFCCWMWCLNFRACVMIEIECGHGVLALYESLVNIKCGSGREERIHMEKKKNSKERPYVYIAC